MNKKSFVLIVEDDLVVANFIFAALSANGYRPVQAFSGKEAIEIASSQVPDVVLLDLGLPDRDGQEVLREIRQWSSIPIIVISARDQEEEKVKMLDLGADDYITKPFGSAELLARIRTAVRHHLPSVDQDGKIKIGKLELDYSKRAVLLNEQRLHLTPIEYKILSLLFQNAGKVLTYEQIIRNIWGPYASENQTLRVNMANIRRKIEKNPGEPRYILTEVGIGYRMADREMEQSL